jgi:hypothetical protein
MINKEIKTLNHFQVRLKIESRIHRIIFFGLEVAEKAIIT